MVDRKILKASAGFTILITLIALVYASYWIFSNVVEVTVGYNLVLSYQINNGNVTLSATLTNINGTAVSDALIHFYNCTDSSGSNRYEIGTAKTNSSGIAIFTYNFPTNGTYYFQAGYWVP